MIGLEYILSLYNMQHIELADKLGIKKQNINLWIKGKQNIPKKYIPVLEELFNVKQEYFNKELTEIEKLEIQKEKLKRDLNPVIQDSYEKFLIGEEEGFKEIPIYDKKEINKIENDIEIAKIVTKLKDSMSVVENNPYMDTYKLFAELMEKSQHEPLVHKTIEALAHYFKVLPNWVSSGDEQDDFEEEILEVLANHDY
ncbi:MAG: helix-turn-helix domain-containing protein [Clostridium sp.]|uniref:YdaS family helix-turn-helix protein n=1 Tax=Clostridium sp. TaxID=1506 RepID=UPI002A750C6C|nr:YdaS family helix-turn-helix protein [Clostridium sp.]MCI6693862.1 helix-turn-helix domain-containing protein [Clostridium sp.]MDY2631458.1 YdaS family helix-turn-helix protein [Clostridium sp.]